MATNATAGKARHVLIACGLCLPISVANAGQLSRAAELQRRPMRAVQLGRNWRDNVLGFPAPTGGLISNAKALGAATTRVQVDRQSHFDALQNRTQTVDIAEPRFDLAHVGASSYLRAGFRIYRDVDTGEVHTAFRPTLEPALQNVPGFTSDVYVQAHKAGTFSLSGGYNDIGPAAQEYVVAVIAHAASLVEGGSFTVLAPAAFDRAAAADAPTDIQQAAPSR